MSSRSNGFSRNFSHALITWEIKNASLCFCFPEKTISGPNIDLYGPVHTKWRLLLEVSKENDRVTLILEMLPNKFRKTPVKVNWASYILDENEGSFSAERCFSFYPNLKLVVHMFRYKSLYEMLCKAAHDDLKIKCHMLVQFGIKRFFPKTRVEGVASLSNDLSTLPKDFLCHDIITVVSNEEFSLHKAMLWNRGENLRMLIEKQMPDMCVNFNLSNSKAADALFTYLYTGDLSYILSEPSLAICDSIKRLGVPDIQYPEDQITLKSKIDKVEHIFHYMVIHFKDVKHTLILPEFYEEKTGSRWQLHLKVENSNDDGQNKKTLYVEAVLVKCSSTRHVRLGFASMNKNHTIVCSQTTEGKMKVGDKLGVVLWEKEWAEIEQMLIGSALLLRFTVQVVTGEIWNETELNRAILRMRINCEKSFTILSGIVRLLMTSHDFSDFHFEVEDQEFKAHKFLVAARSLTFRELFQRDSRLMSIRIPRFKKDVFRVFLSYLYIGTIAETDFIKLMDLYEMGDMYKVTSLKKVCTDILLKTLNKENVLRILVWSDRVREATLVQAAFKLAAKLGDSIKEDPYYFYFTESCPCYVKELLEYIPETDTTSDSSSECDSDSSEE